EGTAKLAATIYETATEYRRLRVTLAAGSAVEDISAVGIALSASGNDVPDPSGQGLGDFTEVTLDSAVSPPDIVVLIGPRSGDINPSAGNYQVWTLIQTADEDIIDAPDTLQVIGPAA